MTGLPVPPLDAVMPVVGQRVLYLMMVPGVVVALAIAARALRRGNLIPAACLVGGTICTFLEPIVDLLGMCWYPRHGQTTILDTLGRPLPWWVATGYLMYMGGCTLVVNEVVTRWGSSQVWRLFAGIVVFEIIFEFYAVHSGAYIYYGRAPLRIWGFPAWWAFVNTSVPLVAGLAINRLRPVLTGWSQLWPVLLIPTLDAGLNAAAGWPTWDSDGARPPMVIVELAGLLTCALALTAVWLATRLHTITADREVFAQREERLQRVSEPA